MSTEKLNGVERRNGIFGKSNIRREENVPCVYVPGYKLLLFWSIA
jgi:hypothetical protein